MSVPPSTLRIVAAAIEDYRTVTPPDEATPAALAEYIAMYLHSSSLTIRPDAATA
ncbi:hypothetical protein ACFWCB_26250 [Streptomyces sp. NPDC060048]|uniref:hypothetical protein n=1 Tax=unclassified Streptomyces TaxID=2593676 RepID=UPI0036CA1641